MTRLVGSAMARATARLRIGAMMWQLPFYHPIRLAQEVAMLYSAFALGRPSPLPEPPAIDPNQ